MNSQRADWISTPGESIGALLRERKISASELTSLLKIEAERTLKLLTGQQPIDVELAERLEVSLGGTKEFWLRREAIYRRSVEEASSQEMEGDAWIEGLAYKELCDWGWLSHGRGRQERISALFGFFGVGKISEWERRYGALLKQARFRAHGTANTKALALTCWLRRGELIAQTFDLKSWDVSALRQMISRMRELTREHDADVFLPALQAMCSEAGVALVVARAPAGSKVSGAVFSLPNGKPVILLSFRYKTDDQFWFSFFHEVGHLILHGPERMFLEGDEVTETAVEEGEANEFAEEILVPTYFRQALAESRPSKPQEFLRLAKMIGVSPGVLIGQLQHMGIVSSSHFNRYKKRYEWVENMQSSD